jgi:hypothetical protein
MAEQKPFRYDVGATVRMRRHPTMPMIVLKREYSAVRGDPVYTLRFENTPDDKRGFLIWDEEIE